MYNPGHNEYTDCKLPFLKKKETCIFFLLTDYSDCVEEVKNFFP